MDDGGVSCLAGSVGAGEELLGSQGLPKAFWLFVWSSVENNPLRGSEIFASLPEVRTVS